MPASRMRHGVTKSGSPTPREMTSSISAAMSKNRRMPDGGQAAMTAFRGLMVIVLLRGDPQAVVRLGVEERLALALVGLQHEVGGGGHDAVDRGELLRDEVRHGADAATGDRAA